MSLLEIDGLSVSFGAVSALQHVSLSVEKGEILGLAGESGCGKSTLGLAVMGLLAPAANVTGEIRLEGRQLIGLGESELRELRGREIGLIVQDPMTALDPVLLGGKPGARRAHSARRLLAPRARLPARSRCCRRSASPTPRSASATCRRGSRAACGSAP